MNEYISKLHRISGKNGKTIVGLMSGTSLDGLDIAVCDIMGAGMDTQVSVREFRTISYSTDIKASIRKVFAKELIDLQHLAILNEEIGMLHAHMINDALKAWDIKPEEIDCIASHGQTIIHAPQRIHKQLNRPNATLQIGDPDHIAHNTGIITIGDFRQKHVAQGYEGAPLALFGDQILFQSPNENRILLNIGGISNFTLLPADLNLRAALSTDCGPGNTIVDNLTQLYFNKSFDNDGQIAFGGRLLQPLLDRLLEHAFFSESFPKTTGPEIFNLTLCNNALKDLGIIDPNPEDLIHTASLFTVMAIVDALEKLETAKNSSIYVSGGGCHNKFFITQLERMSGFKVFPLETLGMNPDAKEAAIFAVLANETLSSNFMANGNLRSSCLGKISLP